MIWKSFFTSLAVITILSVLSVGQVSAVEVPQFPSCTNPQGEQIASYSSGTHGVPGDTNTYTGSDHVYRLNSEQVLQCLCAESGNGIQTNWFKVGQLSEQEQKTYEVAGYTYIPNGAAWGLEETGYVAKNSSYSCRSTGTGGSVQSGSSSQGAGVQASVLGLASTGDVTSLLGFFFAGVIALILGVTLKKKE